MNKKIRLLTILGLAFSFAALATSNVKRTSAQYYGQYYVDFFNNYLREEFTLSNGTTGKGNNLLYKSVLVDKDSLVSKPEDPKRRNYEFQGWCLDVNGEVEWNFETDKVTRNTRLYAKWGIAQQEELVEPEYTPPSTVLEESASTDYVINSIMYFKVDDGLLKVTRPCLLKLEANKDDILPLMEYKVKNSKTMTATYDSNYITVKIDDETKETIQVKDDSNSYIIDNSTYEAKAKKYEDNALEEDSHHVMLAGSSSIEFWTSSKEDLAPIVSFNHGIGGTTIEEWTNQLNQRLVYPYKPKMVVYYVGINNVINSKQSADEIWAHLTDFFNETHAALPDTKVQYIMMNLIPGYPTYFDIINQVNANVVEYAKNNTSWLTLINPGLALIKENGEPNAAYFRTDGLHLSLYGYVIWGGIIKESILNGLENM